MKLNKKVVSNLFKIIITVVLLYLVFTKISFVGVLETVKTSKTGFVLLAVLFFIISQWISAYRLLHFFKAVNYNLSSQSNLKLYLIGMFYNFFIPGGIGGDAYKVYILNKQFNWKIKTLSSAILLDRFNGLIAIGILISILFIELEWQNWFFVGLGCAMIFIILLISYYFVKRLFNAFIKIYFKSLFLSLCIQTTQLICIMFLLLSLGTTMNMTNYLIVFLISSVLSIFSFAGIGVREAVFYKSADYFNYDATKAVAISLLFSVITALISILGIILHFKKTKLTQNDHKIID